MLLSSDQSSDRRIHLIDKNEDSIGYLTGNEPGGLHLMPSTRTRPQGELIHLMTLVKRIRFLMNEFFFVLKLGAAAGQMAGQLATNFANSNPAFRAGVGAFQAMSGGGINRVMKQAAGAAGRPMPPMPPMPQMPQMG